MASHDPDQKKVFGITHKYRYTLAYVAVMVTVNFLLAVVERLS